MDFIILEENESFEGVLNGFVKQELETPYGRANYLGLSFDKGTLIMFHQTLRNSVRDAVKSGDVKRGVSLKITRLPKKQGKEFSYVDYSLEVNGIRFVSGREIIDENEFLSSFNEK